MPALKSTEQYCPLALQRKGLCFWNGNQKEKTPSYENRLAIKTQGKQSLHFHMQLHAKQGLGWRYYPGSARMCIAPAELLYNQHCCHNRTTSGGPPNHDNWILPETSELYFDISSHYIVVWHDMTCQQQTTEKLLHRTHTGKHSWPMRLTFIFISHAVGSNTGCQTLKLKPRCYRCHQAKEALAVLPADSQR